MKRCSECCEDKPSTDFYKDKNAYDGLYSKCKACKKAYDKVRYAEDPERKLSVYRLWYQNNKHWWNKVRAERYLG